MKFQELDPEKKFRIRHKVVEYSYGAFDALLEIATKEKVDVIDLWKIFDGEMYTNVEYYRDTEKAPEMVTTSTEAKEIIPENNSSTTPETNPDPAKLIEEAAAKRNDTKLTEEQVAEIRRLRIEGKSAAYLANKYGVSLATIHNKLSSAPKKEKDAWINKNTTPTAEYISGV